MTFTFQIFEILIREGSIYPLKLIRNSNVMRMLTFMGISAFILDAVHVAGGHVFWIIQPFRRPANENNNNNNVDEKKSEICLHKNSSCETYILQGLRNYATIGICLEIVKALFSNFSLICRSPGDGIVRSVKRINPKFLLFVTGYPTLYRVMISRKNTSMTILILLSISDSQLLAKSLLWRTKSSGTCNGCFYWRNAILFFCRRTADPCARFCICIRVGMGSILALTR